jgi:hypothetical protein
LAARYLTNFFHKFSELFLKRLLAKAWQNVLNPYNGPSPQRRIMISAWTLHRLVNEIAA